MTLLGCTLSSEELGASSLVAQAERAGFDQDGFRDFYEREVLPSFR